MFQVKVLYDFEGTFENALTITSGEELTVTRTDDDWWDGVNSKGQTGLFPSNYVKVLSESTHSGCKPGSAPVKPGLISLNTTIHQDSTVVPTKDEVTGTLKRTLSNALVKPCSKLFQKNDNYFLGMGATVAPDIERVQIVSLASIGFVWKTERPKYTVLVDSPQKDTKFHGIKSFVAFKLTPSFNQEESVFRRYKHFDWLHARLSEKFSMIPIPPLPKKQINGRFEEEFIDHRRVQLQEFVDWICRHPVLANCEVWKHFLGCQDKGQWTLGKRDAENDMFVGSMYCAAISPPDEVLSVEQIEEHMKQSSAFVEAMIWAVMNLTEISAEQVILQEHLNSNYQKVGNSFSEFAKALKLGEPSSLLCESLSSAMFKTASVYTDIGRLFTDQSKKDWIPLADAMHIYQGLLALIPDILDEQKKAVQHRKICEKQETEKKISLPHLNEVIRRTDVMSYAVMAEMVHFLNERQSHLKDVFRNFICNQIEFHKTVTLRLEAALTHFDDDKCTRRDFIIIINN